ncbi:hypothetical protein B296_00050294 [Ensete ventricosum]|uniref:Uncharacterized protein n=1 Tax=Ensete ventricosum TaxID=4639 RepID=A0A426YLW2_ENSVE|nr:hypothetical protein B296_00050294 [Ensete ventricosum]
MNIAPLTVKKDALYWLSRSRTVAPTAGWPQTVTPTEGLAACGHPYRQPAISGYRLRAAFAVNLSKNV